MEELGRKPDYAGSLQPKTEVPGVAGCRGVEEESLPQPTPLGAGLHERGAPTHTTFLRGSHCYKRVAALACLVSAGTTGQGGGEPVRVR